jgi:23S rRNA pseudouridine1911/1915/1917 synthase
LCGPIAFSVKQVLQGCRVPRPPLRNESVPPELAGALDRAVRGLFGVSWGQARAWIERGKVRVDAQAVTVPTARVTAGQRIEVDERGARPRAAGAGRGELGDDQIVHVDAHVVVVDKPSGVSTIPYEEGETDTLDARVRAWLERRNKSAGGHGKHGGRGGRPALGIVHRLDKETSGLVVFTRTWLAKQSLSNQFRHHTVERRYLAIAHGDVRSRTVRTFLVEDRGDGRRGSARGTHPEKASGAREAITHVERIEPLHGATLVACRLETGRTHQIRIHLSECGHPIVGERVYVRGFAGTLLEAPRLMLHAAELGFEHPATQHPVRWESAPPADVQAVLTRLRA